MSTAKFYYLASTKNPPEVDPVLKSVAGPRFLLTTGLTLVNIGSPATLGFAFHPHKLLSNVQLSCFRSVTSVVGTEKIRKILTILEKIDKSATTRITTAHKYDFTIQNMNAIIYIYNYTSVY